MDLGRRSGTDLNLVLVRDRAVDQGRESEWVEGVAEGDLALAWLIHQKLNS